MGGPHAKAEVARAFEPASSGPSRCGAGAQHRDGRGGRHPRARQQRGRYGPIRGPSRRVDWRALSVRENVHANRARQCTIIVEWADIEPAQVGSSVSAVDTSPRGCVYRSVGCDVGGRSSPRLGVAGTMGSKWGRQFSPLRLSHDPKALGCSELSPRSQGVADIPRRQRSHRSKYYILRDEMEAEKRQPASGLFVTL